LSTSLSRPRRLFLKKNPYGNLEEQVGDLYRAADLIAHLLEDTLDHERLSPDYFGKGKDVSDLVMIGPQLQERLLFTVYEVEKCASALRDFIHDPKNEIL
jgi:hypothetical protein